MTPPELTRALVTLATQLGFVRAAACPAQEPAGWPHLQQWLNAGFAGQMHYLPDRAEAYRHPSHVLEGARSLLLLVFPYRNAEPATPAPASARISRDA